MTLFEKLLSLIGVKKMSQDEQNAATTDAAATDATTEATTTDASTDAATEYPVTTDGAETATVTPANQKLADNLETLITQAGHDVGEIWQVAVEYADTARGEFEVQLRYTLEFLKHPALAVFDEALKLAKLK